MAMGPNAITAATQVANGTYNGGSKVTAKLPKGTNAFVHLDASRAVNAFKPLVKQADPTTEIPTLPSGVEFGVTAGSTANSLTMEFYGNVDAALSILNTLPKDAPAVESVREPAAPPTGAATEKAAAPAATGK